MEFVQPTFSSVSLDNFQHCFAKLTSITFSDDDAVRTDINILLDELISVDFLRLYLNVKGYNEIVLRLCHLLPLNEHLLIIKVLRALQAIIVKQQLELSDTTLTAAVKFVIQSLRQCPVVVHDVSLYCLAALIYGECHRTFQFHEELLGDGGLLERLYRGNVASEATLVNVILCCENICVRQVSCDYLDPCHSAMCHRLFVDVLQSATPVSQYSPLRSKIVTSALRGLTNILSATRTISSTNLGSQLAICKTYMMYGLTNEPHQVPDKLHPAFQLPETQSTTQAAATKKPEKPDTKKRKRKPKKILNMADSDDKVHDAGNTVVSSFERLSLDPFSASGLSHDSYHSSGITSESDYSDSEGAQMNRLRTSMERARHCALVYLQCLIKNTERKVMFGYWTSFLPEAPDSSRPDNHTLFTVLSSDPSAKCRLGALITVSCLVYGSKQLLMAAEYSRNSAQAFMTFSQSLGCMLHELHRRLLAGLVAENFPRVITQFIKCLSIVMANAPYTRLKPGLINRVMSKVRHFINHRDINVRVACLSSFGAMCSIHPVLLEVNQILQSPVPPLSGVPGERLMRDSAVDETEVNAGSGGASSGSACSTPIGAKDSMSGCQTPIGTATDTSWLLKLCVKNIDPADDHTPPEPLPVKLESLQVLASLCKNYFPIARQHLNKLTSLVHVCLNDPDPSIQLHGAKMLAEKGQSILHDETMQFDPPSPQLVDMWLGYIDGPLTRLVQACTTQYSVKASLCDCLSMVGPQVFAQFPTAEQMLCITLSLGMIHVEDPVMRAAAVRTIGVFCLYPCLTQDVSFLLDCSSAILDCLGDRSVSVRIKAAWALANLSDTIIGNKDRGLKDFIDEFPDKLIMELLQAGTRSTHDSERVKYNAVRAVGNLLRYVHYTSITNVEQSDILRHCVQAITKCVNSGSMKVRWNACHGISCLLKNTHLLPYISKENMMTFIFDTLLVAIRESKNFKVRIGATEALMAAKTRTSYGNPHQFLMIWAGLIDGLETSEQINDFAEFRYKENLLSVVCLTVMHLCSLTSPDDLTLLSQLSLNKWHLLYEQLDNWTRISPDKEILASVESNMSHLMSLNLDDRQTEGLACLQNLCDICSKQKDITDAAPEKSSFVQTYD